MITEAIEITLHVLAANEVRKLILILFLVAATVAPLAFIPYTFRWAGGALGAIGGALDSLRSNVVHNVRRRGGEKRANLRAQRMQDTRLGQMAKGTGRLARGASFVGQALTNPFSFSKSSRFISRVPIVGSPLSKAHGKVVEARKTQMQEYGRAFQNAGYSQDQLMMHAISVAGGRGRKGFRKWVNDPNSTYEGERLSDDQKARLLSMENTIAPYLDHPIYRGAAAYASVFDGYPTPETFFAMEEISDSPEMLRSMVYDMKRKAKGLNGWAYGMDVDPKGNNGKGKVVWDPKGLKGFLEQTNDPDMRTQKTHSWAGKHLIPEDRIVPGRSGSLEMETLRDKDGRAILDKNGREQRGFNANLSKGVVMTYKDMAEGRSPEEAEIMMKNFLVDMRAHNKPWTMDGTQRTSLELEMRAGGMPEDIINSFFREPTPEEEEEDVRRTATGESPDTLPDTTD